MSHLGNDINSLIDSILNDDETAQEDPIELKKKINFYGTVVNADERWFNLSILNWKEKYIQELTTTALVGYLFRTSREYTDRQNDDLECPEVLLRAFNATDVSPEQRDIFNRAYKTAVRGELNTFLRYNFDYNPDRHVDECYKENAEDPERVGKYEQYIANMNNADSRPKRKVDELFARLQGKLSAEDFAELNEAFDEVNDRNALLFTKSSELAKETKSLHRTIREFRKSNPCTQPAFQNACAEIAAGFQAAGTELTSTQQTFIDGLLTETSLTSDDFDAFLLQSSNEFQTIANDIYPYVTESVRGAFDWKIPVDVFYHFNRYLNNHYELFREVTNILFCSKPDIEFSLQVYGGEHQSEEAAANHRRQIQDNVTASVLTVSNEGWYLLGPFKKNRERLDFYNKNTEILKRLFEQSESDQKLGKDLMEKKVRRKKLQNIESMGPDAPGLSMYKEACQTVDALGAKEVLTPEEKEEYANALKEKEMGEVPEGAIQVDVHVPTTNDEGETVLERKKFYTEAEKPEFMEDNLRKQKIAMELMEVEGCNAREAYNRANDMVDNGNFEPPKAIKDKGKQKVKSRTGQTSTVDNLKNNI